MHGQIPERVTITDSPAESPVGTAFGTVVLTVRSPRSDTSVTVMVNAGVMEHISGPVDVPFGKVAQMSAWGDVEGTKELFFDLNGTAKHVYQGENQAYEIRLLQINKVPFDGQQWPQYVFDVSEISRA